MRAPTSSPPQTATLLLPLLLFLLTSATFLITTPPPLPLPPLPSAAQLEWQLGEMALFLHFGMNTFTNSEWGTGRASPSLFDPTRLDARQWARAAAEAGFSRVVLTAKHHDGFCLWPSAYTNYSVRASPWRGGEGDVVAEVAAAAGEAGVGFGVYLSPWDRHESSYGKTVEYNEHYLGQMTELLTRYGNIKEVFLDGAPGKRKTHTRYLFDCWFDFIHQLQPSAVIFSDGGPDSRWVGDEAGVAGSTCWSTFNRSTTMIGNISSVYSRRGDPKGHYWVPAECDVSIRPGWFWHPKERPKSALVLLDIYYKSVGRNCLLILNVPPNSSGLISDEDLKVLREFSDLRRRIFSINLAQDAVISASSTRGGKHDHAFGANNVLQGVIHEYWAPESNQSCWELHLDLQRMISFNVLQIREPIHMGQRIGRFHLDILSGSKWGTVVNGTTVGYKRLLHFCTVKARYVKFIIDESRADPLVSHLGIHLDKFSPAPDMSEMASKPPRNGSQPIEQVVQMYSEKAAV